MMEVYRKIVLNQMPRILGLGDRNSSSKTFGCFDRYYWHYKLSDFANARFQEASLLLALLYKNKFNGNLYYEKKKVLEWSKSAVHFWLNIQHKDGSFDEGYPYERSFCGTALSSYAISESILLLGLRMDNKKIEKTGNWLSKNKNVEVSNQMAGAAVALYNAYLITKNRRYVAAAEDKIQILLKKQTEEGFFPEYGGCDIGYLSICISHLANYFKKTQDKSLVTPLKKAVRFVEKRVRDDGSYDYKNMSRKTQYIYPYGFAIMGSDIIERVAKGLKDNRIVNPAWMDDRFCIPLTIDYLQAYLELKNADEH
jgi:hypothetical protein